MPLMPDGSSTLSCLAPVGSPIPNPIYSIGHKGQPARPILLIYPLLYLAPYLIPADEG